jgi:tetratricopeptide (TPR) repeat protein
MLINNNDTKHFNFNKARQEKLFLLGFMFVFINVFINSVQLNAQCLQPPELYQKLLAIETANESDESKLQQANALKNQFEKCAFEKDSVYARILHKIGVYQYYSANQINQAIQNTLVAARINTSGKKNTSRQFAMNSYSNLGYYFFDLSMYTKSILYFDSSILIGASYPQYKNYVLNAWFKKCNAFYKKGDYEKDISETTLGLRSVVDAKDSVYIILLLLERAQAYEAQLKTDKAAADVKAAVLLCNPNSYDLFAIAYRLQADILADQGFPNQAVDYYKKAISFRIKTGNLSQVAIDYNDLGYLLRKKAGNLKEAQKYFTLAYQTALQIQNTATCALARDNLSQVSFDLKHYEGALTQSHQALQLLAPAFTTKDITSNPSYVSLNNADERNLLDLLENRVKCLLYFYKETNKDLYLRSAVRTAQLTDTVITNFRHEHLEEQSKLYWRNETRKFFTDAIEACYLSNDSKLAFYFMEKSRAVLLNDQLNEIGASRHLPPEEESRQETFLINIIEQQQKLSLLNDTSKQYADQQKKFLQAKDDFEHYNRSLEQKYPNYYQYKYADEVLSLNNLQQYLAKNNQSFVHYFMNDTVAYILSVTLTNTKLVKLASNEFNSIQLVNFLRLCSDKQQLNSSYSRFISVSNNLYKLLFQPLNLSKGKVIICADNFLIPFDALCTDTQGKHFLLNDYIFSYVYSARYLITQFSNPTAVGNFLGFAPVSFAHYLEVPDLKNAANALHASAAFYRNDKLFTEQQATRSNFFNYASSYSVVSIFSHARADTTDNEPVLFMQDSVIHLSELQR